MSDQITDQDDNKAAQDKPKIIQGSSASKMIIKFFLIASVPISSLSLWGYVISLCVTILLITIIEIHRLLMRKKDVKKEV